MSKNGRPGPVWIDIPINLLGKIINENRLRHFSPPDYNPEKKFKKLRLPRFDKSMDDRLKSKYFYTIQKKPEIIRG